MTLFLDSSALLARHLDTPTRPLVLDTMAAHPEWVASALALTEALMVVDRLGPAGTLAGLDSAGVDRMRHALREDWQHCWIVPVDEACLDRAAELGRTHPLRTADALHLAAADRLPRPVRYLTLEAAQIPVALALGFDLRSPLADSPGTTA